MHQRTNSITQSSSESEWDILGPDITELILSRLPIPTIFRAASVCKLWNSVILSSSFQKRVSNSNNSPWLFICGTGRNNVFPNSNQVFAFDPVCNNWFSLGNTFLTIKDSFTISTGFFFITGPDLFCFKPVLSFNWRQTTPPRLPRSNPLVGVYNDPDCPDVTRFLLVGGYRFDDHHVDTEQCLAVEIYNPGSDSWEFCSNLPEIFSPGSQTLCSALYKGKFYIYGVHSGLISFFDLTSRSWSHVRTLRPPGLQFSFLISCQDRLVLAGPCDIGEKLEFILWRIDESKLEFSEMGIMPQDMLSGFFISEGNKKVAKIKCMGSGNNVYVLSEEPNQNCRVCVCEMSESGECSWRRVPDLPQPVNSFHKVVSFCSGVSLHGILGNVKD